MTQDAAAPTKPRRKPGRKPSAELTRAGAFAAFIRDAGLSEDARHELLQLLAVSDRFVLAFLPKCEKFLAGMSDENRALALKLAELAAGDAEKADGAPKK